MAESSDSGSVHSLQTDAPDKLIEESPDPDKRFFALYSFSPKRLISGNDENIIDSKESKDEGSSSLSIAATNLAATTEIELGKALSHKLSKVSKQLGEGNFFSVGLGFSGQSSSSASCYYCLVSTSSDSLGFDHVSTDDSQEGTRVASEHQQFVVCFISFQESSLDSFSDELDQYTNGLMSMLDKEPPGAFSTRQSESTTDIANNASSTPDTIPQIPQLNQLGTGLQTYLENWPSVVLGYIERTMQYMGSNVQQLIYAALLNASTQIEGATAQQEEDIRRFFQCCNLPGLLDQLQSDNIPRQGSSDITDLWQVQPVIVTITINKDQGVTFDKSYYCQFCKNAADKLVSLESTNITKVRDFLESIKLAFAHNLNKLRRFLKQAELDNYALYRALSYLKKCGCGDLLLRYVKSDAGPETSSVLSVLETFIKEMRQTLT